MRDYLIAPMGHQPRPVAEWPDNDLRRHLDAWKKGRVITTGINGSAGPEEIIERVKLELDIRAWRLRETEC